MTEHDPYVAPEAAVSDPLESAAPIRWGRIVLWGLLIFLVRAVVYATSGFIKSTDQIYGIDVDDMIASTAVFLLYSVFLRAISSRHFRQITALFFVAFLLDLAFSIAAYRFLLVWMGKPAQQVVFQPGHLLVEAAVCLLAFAVWYAFARKPAA